MNIHYWASVLRATPNQEIRSNIPSMSKKGKTADGSPRRLCVLYPPFNGAYFAVRGRVISGCLANRFENFPISNEHKILAWSYWPYISTPNDYLNTVFDDAVSLRGSWRNNALPRSPREKLQLVVIFSLRVKSPSLQERVVCRSPRQLKIYSLGKLEGL